MLVEEFVPEDRGVFWLGGWSVAHTYETIVAYEYHYAHSDPEVTGVLINVSDPLESAWYHRAWVATPVNREKVFSYNHFHNFQRKFLRDPHYRAQWRIAV